MNPYLPKTLRIVAPVMMGLAISWAALLWLMFSATAEMDLNALERQSRLARSSTQLVGEDLSSHAENTARSNDAIRHLIPAPDPVWASENIGTYLHDAFGITGAYVVSGGARTLIAFENGTQTDIDVFDRFPEGLTGLIARSEASSVEQPVPVSALFVSDGQLHSVAVSVFMPEKPEEGLELGNPRPFIVLSRVIDEYLLAEYGNIMQLPGLAIAPSPRPDSSIPLRGLNGGTLAYLTWDFEPTGGDFLNLVVLPVSGAVLFTGFFVFLSIRRANQVFLAQNQLRSAHEALRESEQRFRQLFMETPNIAVQGYDEDRSVIFWNRASEKLYGYQADEAVGRKLEDLIVPEVVRDEMIIAVQDWLDQGRPIPAMELTLQTKEGRPVPVFSSHVMFPNSAGRREMYNIDIDLTERREIEGRLRQAEKMEALGNLAGGIAHDFNNMIQPIMTMSQLVKEELPDESESGRKLDIVLTAARKAKDLVSHILAFSRKTEPERSPRDVCDVVAGAITLARQAIPTNIKVEVNLDTDTGVAFVDAVQIESAVLNVAANAVHAMEGRSGKLTFALGRINLDPEKAAAIPSLRPGPYAKLEVADTGHGMDDETLAHIFDPFFTTKGVGEGSGMGMASAYGVIQKHEGCIQVYSTLGSGTTVEIFIPLMGSGRSVKGGRVMAAAEQAP